MQMRTRIYKARVCFAVNFLLLLIGLCSSSTSWGASDFIMKSTVGFGDEFTVIGISHRDPNFVMIGTTDGAIHRTVDGGDSWERIVVVPYRHLFHGRERKGDPNLDYGFGLEGKSPRLQKMLQGKGLHTAGVNLQEFVYLEAGRRHHIAWIEVDWHDENTVYVGTDDGLYRSKDKGRTFIRMWQGRGVKAERSVNTVITHPSDPKLMFIGTASGLYRSHDRGSSFIKEMDFYIRKSYIRALYIDGEAPDVLHMAMSGAAMASTDRGMHWITTYWHLYGKRSNVKWLALGPGGVRAMGTGDGIFASWQGGQPGSWKRRGMRFVEHGINGLFISKNPLIWLAMNKDAIWRSVDGGNNWRKIMQTGSGEYPVRMQAFGNDEEAIWLITNRHVYRRKRAPRSPSRYVGSAAGMIAELPPINTFWEHVIKHKKLYFEQMQNYRRKEHIAALLPDLKFYMKYGRAVENVKIRAFPYTFLPFTNLYGVQDNELNVEVMAFWDLQRLWFTLQAIPEFGRVASNSKREGKDITERIYRMYGEYSVLLEKWMMSRPADAYASQMLKIRLEEISAFLDAVSDGYWSKHVGDLPG